MLFHNRWRTAKCMRKSDKCFSSIEGNHTFTMTKWFVMFASTACRSSESKPNVLIKKWIAQTNSKVLKRSNNILLTRRKWFNFELSNLSFDFLDSFVVAICIGLEAIDSNRRFKDKIIHWDHSFHNNDDYHHLSIYKFQWEIVRTEILLIFFGCVCNRQLSEFIVDENVRCAR